MSDLKIDQVGMPLTAGKITQNVKAIPMNEVKQEGVMVSNQWNKMVNLLSPTEELPNEQSRVAEMKRLVQSGDYKIDVNALSDALMKSGVLGLNR